MTFSPDLSPLELHREGSHLRFRFEQDADSLPELPADYENLVRRQLDELLKEDAEFSAEIDLSDQHGISSRQLGSIIALRKALQPRIEHITLRGANANIRQLLRMSRIDELFDVES